MESLLLQEIQSFGAQDIHETRAGVYFQGTLELGYRACLWSRIANRILLPLATFAAPTPEKLYGGVKQIRWSDHLTPQNTIAVDFSASTGSATSPRSAITHTHYGALKVKDAIVDQMREIHGERPSVNPTQPDLRINVYLNNDEATVSLDLSGDSLHKRGYRKEGHLAPLKENLAAAILMTAGWPEAAKKGASFIDPMCGSGTLPIEAAMIASDRAPGLARAFWGFTGWKKHEPQVWQKLIEEAKTREIHDKKLLPTIIGYDADFNAVRESINNLEHSGMRGKVHIEKRDWSACEPVAPHPLAAASQPEQGPLGLVVINPPYGERIGEMEALKVLHKDIGDGFKKKFKGWQGYVFTGEPELAKVIGLKASRRFVLFNGAIECRLLKYDLY